MYLCVYIRKWSYYYYYYFYFIFFFIFFFFFLKLKKFEDNLTIFATFCFAFIYTSCLYFLEGGQTGINMTIAFNVFSSISHRFPNLNADNVGHSVKFFNSE